MVDSVQENRGELNSCEMQRWFLLAAVGGGWGARLIVQRGCMGIGNMDAGGVESVNGRSSMGGGCLTVRDVWDGMDAGYEDSLGKTRETGGWGGHGRPE